MHNYKYYFKYIGLSVTHTLGIFSEFVRAGFCVLILCEHAQILFLSLLPSSLILIQTNIVKHMLRNTPMICCVLLIFSTYITAIVIITVIEETRILSWYWLVECCMNLKRGLILPCLFFFYNYVMVTGAHDTAFICRTGESTCSNRP